MKNKLPAFPLIENWDERTNSFLVWRINRLEILKPDVYADLMTKLANGQTREDWLSKRIK
jgi:hypothetical protein